MADNDLALIAHLLRRAGFGASRMTLEAYAAKGYAAVVEELLHPEQSPEVDEDFKDVIRLEPDQITPPLRSPSLLTV